MTQKFGIKAISILALVLMFILIILPSGVTDAVMPQNYVSDVIEKDLDWWTADEYLGLDTLKRTVASWKNDAAYDFEYLKQNPVIVAVIDSGIDLTHEIFLGKYDENGRPLVGADENGVGKYDVLLRDGRGNPIVYNTAKGYSPDDVIDDEGNRHGTHVCGIVATLIHELDLEEYIKILPIKSSAAGNFGSASVESAIKYAISQGADVINMSLASSTESFANIKYSNAHKSAILVAAAGNDGARTRQYPAALSNVIGVMNYTYNAKGITLSNTSNYGVWSSGSTTVGYDVCAPGSDIFSARGKEDKPFVPKEGDESEYYKSLSGTSMATPIVSFGAALITLKYNALAGGKQKQKGAEELANLVRNASTSTLTKGGVKYKIFDINALVGIAWHEADIEINNTLLAKQRLGSLEKIRYSLNVLPKSDYGKGEVEWFANGVKIGKGFEIEYIPQPKVGITEIKAVWTHADMGNDGDIVVECFTQIEVDYMLITNDAVSKFEMSMTSDGVEEPDLSAGETGKEYHFSIGNILNISNEDINRIQWFVNDELKYIGAEYDFTPEEYGEYRIRVELNDFSSGETVLSVPAPPVPDTEYKKELKVYTIVSIALISAVVLAVLIVITVKYAGKKRKQG